MKSHYRGLLNSLAFNRRYICICQYLTNKPINLCHSLHGAATFEQHNGRIVLYLDGTSATFAETPAVPIRQTDLTIAIWVKLLSLSTRQMIYTDWSEPHQFWFRVETDGLVKFSARRDVAQAELVFALKSDPGWVYTKRGWSSLGLYLFVTWFFYVYTLA